MRKPVKTEPKQPYTLRIPQRLYKKLQAHIKRLRKEKGLTQLDVNLNVIVLQLLEQEYGKA